ncbi:LTA synthase family protein [Cohnella sp. AR92]|nr:LTA synthase family protein [Cohnella sp. AR92]
MGGPTVKNVLRKEVPYLQGRYMLLVLGAWIVFLMEFLSRSSIESTMTWTYTHIPAFLLNTALITALLLIMTAATGRTRWAYWIIFVLIFALSFGSGVKMRILGMPLLPWDLALTGEGGDMVQYLHNIVNLKSIIGILVFLGASVGLLYKVPHLASRIRGRERAILAAVAAAGIAVVFFLPSAVMKDAFGVEDEPDNQMKNVLDNGLLLTTVMNLEHMDVNKVQGYDSGKIKTIVTQINTPPSIAGGVAPPADNRRPPNLIVILSESFWDPTLVPNLKFSRDPLANFHRLAQEYPSGWFLSPQFGGGTANVEFEVLTGNSMRFLPQGSVAYNQYIDRQVDSLASIAARQGYTSTAISPYYSWFFNADKVYKDFGFSKFIPIEYFNQRFVGPYISDDETANTIISETEKTPGPDMIFANTMENHFHYWPGKFKENTIKVTGVEGQAKGLFETYAQGTQDADKMLQKLVDAYSKKQEPTLILFFGDHLPALGDDYSAYKDSKYITGTNDPDFLQKMHRTPFLIWNNYLPKDQSKLYMSPSFMSPYLLDKAGLKGTYYTEFLKQQYAKTPVIPPKDHDEEMRINEADLKDYETLQYDILFGDQHAYNDAGIKDKIINPNFLVGLGPMTVSSVDTGANAGKGTDDTIGIKGANFPETAVVLLNGRKLATTYISHEELKATVPGGSNLSGAWNLAVDVYDKNDKVIGGASSSVNIP